MLGPPRLEIWQTEKTEWVVEIMVGKLTAIELAREYSRTEAVSTALIELQRIQEELAAAMLEEEE